MNRKVIFAFTLLLLIAFTSCKKRNAGPDSKGKSNGYRQIVDLLGRTVVFPEKLERVAFFGGPGGQIALLLGVERIMCAVSSTFGNSPLVTAFYPDISHLPAPRTANGCINLEELVASRAQLVIAGRTDCDLISRMTKIPVACFKEGMDNGRQSVLQDVRFYAHILGCPVRGEMVLAYLEKFQRLLDQRLENLDGSKRLCVYNGFSLNHLTTLGGGSFLDEQVESAGCLHASQSLTIQGNKNGPYTGFGDVSMEQVLSWNPDLIVLDMGDLDVLSGDSRWSSIQAVKNKRVYRLPSGIFLWYRPSVEATALYPLWLAFMAYPERFSDLSLLGEMKAFYRDVFRMSLSDDQLRSILNGKYRDRFMRGINEQ